MDFAVLIVFAIVLALITVVFYNLGRLVPKSRFGSKNGLIWICILTGFIVSLLGIIIAVNLAKHRPDELKLEKAIEETNSILVNVQNHVEGISFDTLDWSFMEDAEIKVADSASITAYGYRYDIGFPAYDDVKLQEWAFTFAHLITRTEKMSKHIDDLNKAFPAACGEKIYITEEEFHARAVRMNISIRPALDDLAILDNDVNTMESNFRTLAEEQKKLKFVKSMIKDRLETMKNMTKQFQTDISKSDTTKQEWGQKMRELATFWITENITKLLVNIVCVILIIMSIISIISLYRPSLFLLKTPSKLISILFCITVILSIISGLIVLILSIGTVGHFDCPLKNDTFGVANFTVPLPDSSGNRDFVLCTKPDSTVFGQIFPFISRDEISEKLKIEEYKKNMLEFYIPSISHINLPSSFAEDWEAINKVYENVKKLVGKKCIVEDIGSSLDTDCLMLNQYLGVSKEFKDLIGATNENIVNQESIFKTTVAKKCNLIVQEFENAVVNITQNITAVDFPCESISAGYSECAHSICQQFYSPLDTYSIYLILTILVCLIALILFASIYNSLTIMNEYVELDSKSPAITPP